jgi:hypothetical protein
MRPIFCLILSHNSVDNRNQLFLRLGAAPAEMGDELVGLGTGPLSDRQPFRAARSALCLSLARDRRAQPELSPDRTAGSVEASGAAQVFQRARDSSVSFDGIHVGLQQTAAALLPGSNQPVSFADKVLLR